MLVVMCPMTILVFVVDTFFTSAARTFFVTVGIGCVCLLVLICLFVLIKHPARPVAEATVSVDEPADALYRRATQTMLERRDVTGLAKDPELLALDAQTRASFRSHGERIHMRVRAVGPSTSEVVIRSEPLQRLTRFDYGKNERNLRELVNSLQISGAKTDP